MDPPRTQRCGDPGQRTSQRGPPGRCAGAAGMHIIDYGN